MISVSENQVIYVGDGQTTSFGFNFKILNRSDLHLTRVDKNGNETAVTSDYYIHMDTSIVDYPGYAPGAEEPEVDRPLVLARGEKLVIYRDVPITQESQMPTQWPFDVIEKAHDKSCMIDQQLQGQLDRSLKIARSNWTNNFDATIPVKAGYGWRVSDDGNSIIALANPEGIYDQCEGLKNEVVALKEATNVLKGQTQTAADTAIAAASSANNSKTSAQAAATSAANSALDAGSKANIVEAYYTNVAEAYDEDEEYSAGDLVFVSNGDMYRALTDVSGEAPGSGYSWTKVQSNLMLTFEMDAAGDLMPRTAPQTSAIWDLDQNGDITPTAYGSGSETHGAEEQIIENQRNIAKLDATKADKTEIVDAYSKSEIDVQFATVNGDISELNSDIANRLEKNQGAENSGKYLKVDTDGAIITDTVSGESSIYRTLLDYTQVDEDAETISWDLPQDNFQDLIGLVWYIELKPTDDDKSKYYVFKLNTSVTNSYNAELLLYYGGISSSFPFGYYKIWGTIIFCIKKERYHDVLSIIKGTPQNTSENAGSSVATYYGQLGFFRENNVTNNKFTLTCSRYFRVGSKIIVQGVYKK